MARDPEPAQQAPVEVKVADAGTEPPVPRVYFWTGVGITAALAVTSVATGVMAWNENQKYNDPATPLDEQLTHRDTGQALEVAMWTTMGLGIAAAAGTAVLYFFTTPRDGAAQEPGKTARFGITPLMDGGAITLEGRF